MLNQTRMSGISPREAEFIATMSERGTTVFSVPEALEASGMDRRGILRLVGSLVRKRKLQRIEKGKYLLIPPIAWKRGEFTEQGIIVASQLVEPYYISYWTALNLYGWTEQPSKTIFVATTKLKKPLTVQGVAFRFVRLRPERFFGHVDRWVGSQKVAVADREKTIVDCLDQPRYCGEIVEVVKGIWNGRSEIDFAKVLEYASRMNNGAIEKRLGFILGALDLLTPALRNELQSHLSRGYVSLDPSGGKATGTHDPEWRVRVNVNPTNLTEWIRN